MQNPASNHEPRRDQRAYKACLACRRKKARCETQGQGPCARCIRQRTECVLTDLPPSKRQKNSHDTGPAHKRQNPVPAPSWQDHPQNLYSNQSHAHVANPSTSRKTEPTCQTSSSHDSPNALARSVVRTVISGANDAFSLLFDVVPNRDQEHAAEPSSTSGNQPASINSVPRTALNPNRPADIYTQPDVSPQHVPSFSSMLIRTWQSCHFVRMGWLTAREAIHYVDLFFQTMSPLSPVLTDFYSNHDNHIHLIKDEPMLCCTILMISSRYHILPVVGGTAKGYFLHNRLWKHCEHLILRIMLGQEKGHHARARSVGSIEALLLISEWQPRSLHFPPESHGWDADLLMRSSGGEEMEENDITPEEEEVEPSVQWLEEVVEPTRRSDRMSWMLLGCAVSLAHELGIYESDTYSRVLSVSQDREKRTLDRKYRLQKLLYVFHTQLALRLGYTSLMPSSLHHVIPKEVHPKGLAVSEGVQWSLFMDALMDLTKLSISIKDVFFSSPSSTRALLLSGRYSNLLDNYRSLLTRWHEEHLGSNFIINKNLHITIRIEYYSIRALLNSVGMQAVVEKNLETNPGLMPEDTQPLVAEDHNYGYIQEVLDSCSQILQIFQQYNEKESLVRLPSRVVYRIFTSSILLLKAMSIGVRQAQLEESLQILDSSIQALRSDKLDDLLCVPRYASLLDIQLQCLRRYFAESLKYSRPGATRRPSPEVASSGAQMARSIGDSQIPVMDELGQEGELEWSEMDHWLRLPFDPSMAPFDLTGSQAQTGLDLNGLDFVWNISN